MTLRPRSSVAGIALALLVATASVVPSCSAFHHECIGPSRYVHPSQPQLWATGGDDASATSTADSADEGAASSSDDEKKPYDTRVMRMFLEQKYPAFMQVLSNQDIWKELSSGVGGYTVFAPNNKAFDKLGEKRLRQLNDPRNLETTEKIGRYHAIAAPVTSKQIFDSNTGGIKTLGVSTRAKQIMMEHCFVPTLSIFLFQHMSLPVIYNTYLVPLHPIFSKYRVKCRLERPRRADSLGLGARRMVV
jgi:hypothetical protein